MIFGQKSISTYIDLDDGGYTVVVNDLSMFLHTKKKKVLQP